MLSGMPRSFTAFKRLIVRTASATFSPRARCRGLLGEASGLHVRLCKGIVGKPSKELKALHDEGQRDEPLMCRDALHREDLGALPEYLWLLP